ncbi:hypothetical protein IAR55_000767 [Kwoniella newhampshirensis]|uniref:N-acetylglucosaminylphosphatidylinositol deacetylase n=1 Tax=Kwoniella newhampshirensis TaxID=1651941 RepID=A0AAW0Z403_9TREE
MAPTAIRPSPFRKPTLPLFLTLLIPLFALLSHLSPLPTSSLLPLSGSEDEVYTDRMTALILTAHPDDEVMFFSPTVLHLTGLGWDVRGLCLSIGDSQGLGEKRRKELVESYSVLGVEKGNVEIIDHPYLQDGMNNYWDEMTVAGLVQDSLSYHPVDLIITFDKIGITQHSNHISLPSSLVHLPSPTPRIIHLKSPPLLTKFTGPFYPLYIHLNLLINSVLRSIRSLFPSSGGSSISASTEGMTTMVIVSTPQQYFTSLRAMMAHDSQLVWFRWLYISFSRLMWVNELVLAQ